MSSDTPNNHVAATTKAAAPQPMAYKLGDVVQASSEWGGKIYLIVLMPKPEENKYTAVLLRGNGLALLRDDEIEKKLTPEDLEILATGGEGAFYDNGGIWINDYGC